MRISDYFDKPLSAERILIIQLGDIGDVVWSLPAIEAIRNSYPHASIAALLREGVGSLFSAGRLPLKTFEVLKGKGSLVNDFMNSFRLVGSLRRQRYDLVFDFRADERGGYMAFLTGAPVRAARYYPLLRGLRNHLFTHLAGTSGKPIALCAADQSLYILQAFGIKAEDTMPRLNLSHEVLLRAADILSSAGIPVFGENPDSCRPPGKIGIPERRWVTLNPFSRWPYKEWGMEKWVQIIHWLYEEYEMMTVIVGSSGERTRAETIIAACPGMVFNMAGRTTLAELAGLLKFSRLHIGVDSAAPHIAAAVGVPTVTIYGPSDWRYWAPKGKTNHVVVSGMPCVPCSLKGCSGSGRSLCLDKIDVEKVQAAIRAALQ
jgi:heptosyltransferase-3